MASEEGLASCVHPKEGRSSLLCVEPGRASPSWHGRGPLDSFC